MSTPNQITGRLKRTRGADAPEPEPTPSKAARRRGRPEIELEPEMVAVADYMARNGATVPEIAKEVGVSERKVYDWFHEHPHFMQAVKDGRVSFDQRVISALGQRAVGYTYETEKVFSNGFRATVTEHVPADVGAAINWLVNRQGWRRGDNVAADAIDAATQLPGEAPNTRSLALAAMALLASALHSPDTPHQDVIEATANQPQPADDEELDDDFEDDSPDIDIDD